jgi:ubiquinone/menaquinone biosynthesis C-methylase UbiE
VSNATAYSQRDFVDYYAQLTDLQRPEESILNTLLPNLSCMNMLDIGIGGGRTTLHFAKWTKSYVGIDYSPEMIAACERRFAHYPQNISFKVGDARSMHMFGERMFDFILFSFNGIDSVSHSERLQVFEEIRRVGKPGGLFCFSSHNFQSLRKKFALTKQFSRSPERSLQKTIRWLFVKFVYNRHINERQLRAAPYTIINDGAHDYRLCTYYIKPATQLEQLAKHFCDVRIFSLSSGQEVPQGKELHGIDDDWLYYLCVIK